MKKVLYSLLFISVIVLSGCGHQGSSNGVEIPAGKVLLEEFSDIQCPACKSAHPTLKALKDRFGDDLVVHFKHFPLEQIHPNAFHAAEAAECARDYGEDTFWAFVDEAYNNQKSLNDETFKTIASQIGISDAAGFEKCLGGNDKAAGIRKSMKEGLRRGVNATPTFFLNGEKLEDRRFELIAKKIEDLLLQSE